MDGIPFDRNISLFLLVFLLLVQLVSCKWIVSEKGIIGLTGTNMIELVKTPERDDRH